LINTTKIRIAVGLVTYNNSESELQFWLKSLTNAVSYAKNFWNDFGLVLYWIDNGKPQSVFSGLDFAIELESQGNIGYTAAVNQIITRAFQDEEITHFQSANPDGAFHPYFFEEMLLFANNFPQAIIESAQFPEEHPKLYDQYTFDTTWATGTATLYPRHIVESVGLMDPNFFMYCEDVDFSWRARLQGFSIKHCPGAKYGHHVVNRQNSDLVKTYFFESGRYLAEKWGGTSFKQWCEQMLLDEKLYQDSSQFKTYEVVPVKGTSKQLKSIANFDHHFYFSEGRW